jgi:hypothetical protein
MMAGVVILTSLLLLSFQALGLLIDNFSALIFPNCIFTLIGLFVYFYEFCSGFLFEGFLNAE